MTTNHPPRCEIRALLMLLAISYNALKGPDARGYEIVRFQQIKILDQLDIVFCLLRKSLRHGRHTNQRLHPSPFSP